MCDIGIAEAQAKVTGPSKHWQFFAQRVFIRMATVPSDQFTVIMDTGSSPSRIAVL